VHLSKDRIPVKIEIPGATARQAVSFGDATGYGTLGGEYFSLAGGADMAPLLHGLPDDACAAPHWGYVISGELVVSYTDGTEETCAGGELFHWPPGHSVRVTADAEVVLFSPEAEHTAVMDHMLARLASA
jgi:hypothetical protein